MVIGGTRFPILFHLFRINPALFYLVRAGLMNRIHGEGAIHLHTPTCDARAAATEIPRG